MKLAGPKPTREDSQDARLLRALLTTPELSSMSLLEAVEKLYRMGLRASRHVEAHPKSLIARVEQAPAGDHAS